MIEENPNINQTPVSTPVVPSPLVPTPRPNKLKDVILKVKGFADSNKKLLRTLMVTLAILLVLVIAGIIYSRYLKGRSVNTEVLPTPEATAASNIPEANETEVKLKELKEKVIKLDVYQKHLAPPALNFDISF